MCASEELRRTAYSLVMYVFMRVPTCELVSMQLPPERTDSEVPISLQDMRSVFRSLQLRPWLMQTIQRVLCIAWLSASLSGS